MTSACRVALAVASIVSMVGGVTIAAGQTGPMDRKMDQMGQLNDFKPYTAESVKAARSAGKTVLLFFHAPWCPVCKAQEPKVKSQLNGAHKDVVAFRVDYDSNMALRKELNVEKQSTLILYQGMKEVARLSYKSDDQSIAEFFSHAKMAMSGAR